MCGRVLRTNASPARRVDKPVDNADALPTALPTLSGLSPTSSTGPTTGDSHRTTPHIPSPRLPPPTVQDNICALSIPSFNYQMTPKISLNTRCSISISENLSINGQTRSSDQLGIWSYNINP